MHGQPVLRPETGLFRKIENYNVNNGEMQRVIKDITLMKGCSLYEESNDFDSN